LYENIVQLKLESSDGKKHNTDCTHSEGLLRIIQTIPSPEAEPFKRRLVKVGYERLKEIENPELASKRARENYKAKLKGTLTIGLKNECEVLLFEKN
jgi:DNA-damage-inducible protein D